MGRTGHEKQKKYGAKKRPRTTTDVSPYDIRHVKYALKLDALLVRGFLYPSRGLATTCNGFNE